MSGGSNADLTLILKAVDQNVKQVLSEVTRETGNVGKNLDAAGKSGGGLVDTIGKLGMGVMGVTALAGGIAGIATSMVSGNAQMEKYETQLGTLMGSSDAAKERLAELAKFGAETPFELPEIAAAEKVLLGFGLTGERAVQMTGKSGSDLRTVIGDIAAGTGADFQEIALNFGKFSAGATGEAISRLQELGVVTREQMTAMGVQFSKAGELISPLPEAMSVAVKIAESKFGGGMQKLSQTFEGQMSTLSDNFHQAKNAIMAPIFDVLKDSLAGLNNIIGTSTFQEWLKRTADLMAGGVAAAMDMGRRAFETFGPIVSRVAQIVSDAWATVQQVFARDWAPSAEIQPFVNLLGLLATVIRDQVLPIGQKLVLMWQTIFKVSAAGDFKAGIQAFVSTAQTVIPQLVQTVAGWAKVFVDWVKPMAANLVKTLHDNAPAILAWITQTAVAIVEAVAHWAAAFVEWVKPMVGDMVAKLRDNLPAILTWIQQTAFAIVEKLATWAGAFLDWIGPMIPPMLVALGGILLAIGDWIVTTGAPALIDKLGEWAKAFGAWIGPRLPTIIDELGKLLAAILDWIVSTAAPAIGTKVLEWGKSFVGWVLPAIPQVLVDLGKLLLDILAWIAGAIPQIVAKVKEWATAFLSWIPEAARQLPAQLGGFLTSIQGWATQAQPQVAEAARSIATGLLAFGPEAAAGVPAAMNALFGAMVVEANSPMPYQIGQFIGRRIVDGIQNYVRGAQIELPVIQQVQTVQQAQQVQQATPFTPVQYTAPSSYTPPSYDPGAYGGYDQSYDPVDGRASGGSVDAFTPYMVGERGPELFVPSVGGSIVPNGGGMGGTLNVNVTVSGDEDQARVIAAAVSEVVKQLVLSGRTSQRPSSPDLPGVIW